MAGKRSRESGGAARRTRWALAILLLLAPGRPVADAARGPAEGRAADAWDEVLTVHVVDGGVDYAGLKADDSALEVYAEWLATRPASGGGCGESLAFWTNAYNASVLRLVVARYPALVSVRDIPGFFTGQRVVVAGERLTLDEIEQRALRCGDPRVHFALVCAAESCPPLRAESYRADLIDLQLDDQTRRFLADSQRGASWDEGSRTLHLSMLFEWYRDDFAAASEGSPTNSRLVDWVVQYLAPGIADRIGCGEAGLEFLEYDWSLNDRRRPVAEADRGLGVEAQE